MTMTKSNIAKRLALGAAMTVVLGGGATALLVPSFASAAVATHSADDSVAHVRHSGDDAVGHVRHSRDGAAVVDARHGADDAVAPDDSKGSGRQGADDTMVDGRHGGDDPIGHQ